MGQLFRYVWVIAVLIVSVGGRLQAYAEAPEKTGLYLSFEQRLLTSYVLLAHGTSPEERELIHQRAKKYILEVLKQPVQTVKVKNFAEFLEHFRGEWPNTHKLSLDMELIEKNPARPLTVYEASSPRVQRQIERYKSWQSEQLSTMVAELSEKTPVSSMMAEVGAEKLPAELSPLVIRDLEHIFSQKMGEMLFKSMDALAESARKVSQSGLKDQKDQMVKIFLESLLTMYFNGLGDSSKKLMVSSFLGSNLLASEMQKFELMVQNAGISFQKFLQIMGRQQDVRPELREVFQVLEDAIRKVPWIQVRELIEKERHNYNFTYFEREPLGVGSAAQVHRAKLLLEGQSYDVVVRFLKPGVEERALEDERILRDVARTLDKNPDFRKAGAPLLEPLLPDVFRLVRREFDIKQTEADQALGAKVYNQTLWIEVDGYKHQLQVHVPKLYSQKKSNLMVQEMVIGKKLDKEAAIYKDIMPSLKKEIVEHMTRLWLREVLFGEEGFYHADLHPGNFMLQVSDAMIYLYLLDYGMVGQISKEYQKKVLVLGVGLQALDADLIARAYWQISRVEENTISYERFVQAVEQRVQQLQSEGNYKLNLEKWSVWVMDQGVRLSSEFIDLNRGMVIADKLLADSKSSKNIFHILNELAQDHPLTIYQRVVQEEKVPLKTVLQAGLRAYQKKKASQARLCEHVL
ncbi:MAG: AarF/UbiB family protein [Bdellovibrio sp.]